MKKILFLDIDDTLLVSNNMYIYVHYNNGEKIKLNTNDFAKFSFNNLKNYKIDYADFDNPYKIKDSIINSKPLYDNLKIIDEYVKNDWELGILTARGEENAVKEVIHLFLKKNLKNNFILKYSNIYAVGDRKINYSGKNAYYKKLLILKKYINKYDKVCLIDDSVKMCNIISNFNKTCLLSSNIDFINV